MYSGHPAFGEASDADNFYKLLMTDRSDLFWKAHSNPQRKPAGFYSEDFKDLMNTLIHPNAGLRLSVADIVGHPWLTQGDIATAE